MGQIQFAAERYCDQVISGEIPSCSWVRMACLRHRQDLESGSTRGLHFDPQAAKMAIAFFYILKHSKGEWAGKPFSLEDWQQFLIWVLFGWKITATGARRFKTAYIEIPRKNGKSTIAAGLGLLLLVADNEPGAEIYAAATKKDQAKITHTEATNMVRRSPQLAKLVKVVRDNLHVVETASKFEPLGRDTDSMDGLNVHGALIDEVHAHKTRDLWDLLETATGSRRQPLQVGITTAGSDRQSLCYHLHDYSQKILNGTIQDDSFFGIIWTVDDPEDWENEAEWQKANPNLGISVKLDDMRRLAKRAREIPAQQNSFKRLKLNIWTQATTRWIKREAWDLCNYGQISREDLLGLKCYGGLDLSSNIDLAAFVLIFPPITAEEKWKILPHFWIPEDNVLGRVRNDRVPYDAWIDQGWITTTPGNVIDYDWILADINEAGEDFDLVEIAFDRWGATKIQTDLLDAGHTIVKFGQGYASMNPPMREIEKMILGGELDHGGNPVLTWMADNLVARSDPAGNLKPDKEKSREKIDGMVALVMAVDRATRHQQSGSIYDEGRGLRSL